MNKCFLFLFLLLTLFSNAQDIDVLHYRFNLELTDRNDTIKGLAAIKVIHLTGANKITFDLTGVNHSGKGMKVLSASSGSPEASSLPVQQEAERFSLTMPLVKKGDTTSLFIRYQGMPDDGLIISKNKFGDRTFFADNWPNRAHRWIPCIDRPDDKASFEFMVTAPAHYDVISNGLKVEEKSLGNGNKFTHWREDIALPTKVMVIGAARFAVKTFGDSPANLPISAWVYPQDSTQGFHDYALAPEIVRFFSNYIAPFPYRKLANVQSKTIFGGMENASAIFYAENSVTGDRSSEDLLAHEIAHQWFGDMASEASFAHLWLSEGFATYFTNLYFEQKYGKEAAGNRLKMERSQVIDFAKSSSNPVVDSTPNLMSLLNANSYQKGAWILHMLRSEVGDETFQKIIQTYYNRYKGGNADSKDFSKISSEVSGKDLQPFFQQWLYKPGIPVVKITSKWTNGKLALTVQQTQKNLYEFPLEIKITETEGTEKITKLAIRKKIETFYLPLKSSPSNIILDPNTKLLFSEH